MKKNPSREGAVTSRRRKWNDGWMIGGLTMKQGKSNGVKPLKLLANG